MRLGVVLEERVGEVWERGRGEGVRVGGWRMFSKTSVHDRLKEVGWRYTMRFGEIYVYALFCSKGQRLFCQDATTECRPLFALGGESRTYLF